VNRELRKALEASPRGREYLASKATAKRERKRRTAPKRKERVAKKRATKEERRAKVTAVREAVMARAGHACEWCRVPASMLPLDMHHVLSGPVRRSAESAETCAAICRPCHVEWHRGSALLMRDAKEWALRHGFKDALRAIDRRIAKVEESR
jgi:hypothetical protein